MRQSRKKWSIQNVSVAEHEHIIQKQIEDKNIKEQTEILSTFMPSTVLEVTMRELKDIHRFTGVLLFVEISGLVSLIENYNESGTGGIHELTVSLNYFIATLVEIIHNFGGDVLNLSVDAILVVWETNPDTFLKEIIHEVILCGTFIQDTLRSSKSEMKMSPEVKLAISCGNLSLSVIGDEKSKQYLLLGEAIYSLQTMKLLSTCVDEIIISSTAWYHLAEDNYDVIHLQDGNVKISKLMNQLQKIKRGTFHDEKFRQVRNLTDKHKELKNKLMRNNTKKDSVTDIYLITKLVESLLPRNISDFMMNEWSNILSAFIIEPLLNQVKENHQLLQYLTEMKELSVEYIFIIPETKKEEELWSLFDFSYQTICSIVSKSFGIVNKVSSIEDYITFSVFYGLNENIKREIKIKKILHLAFEIQRIIENSVDVRSVSIGITHGLVYCGILGYPFRREYTVSGEVVQKAQKIVQTYENKVVCDYATYNNSQLSSTLFKMLPSRSLLDGSNDADYLFEVSEDPERTLYEDESCHHRTLLGRKTEIEFVEEVLAGHYPFSGILFKGDNKVGKTALLEYCYDICPSNFITAFVTLFGSNQTPFFCVSLIYRQLYDKLSMLRVPELLLDKFKRNLWDFNEIIQENLIPSTSNGNNNEIGKIKSIFDTFSDMTGLKPTVIFVDDIQHIDKRSLEVIETTLRNGELKLICTGTFEEISWGTLWQFSLNNQMKIIDLDTLQPEFTAPLICDLLKVSGVQKKLCTLIDKHCEAKPGLIEEYLTQLINTGDVKTNYVLLDTNKHKDVTFPNEANSYNAYCRSKKSIIPILILINDNFSEEKITLGEFYSNIFSALEPYEQLVLKTAAVLGKTFSRNVLMDLLNYTDAELVNRTIESFLQKGIFGCLSKYINNNGRQVSHILCSCDKSLVILRRKSKGNSSTQNISCSFFYFKNETLRIEVYHQMLGKCLRKEIHSRASEILEKHNNLCPNCLRNNLPSLFRFAKYSLFSDSFSEVKLSEDIENNCSDNVQKIYRDISIMRVFDPSVCFCLEIVIKLYDNLIYHNNQAGHYDKALFYQYQNGMILFLIGEAEDAIQMLKKGTELCIRHIYDKSSTVEPAFAKCIFAKICVLIAEIYLSLRNHVAAKNYCMLAMRQFNNIPLKFLYLSQFVRSLLFNGKLLLKTYDNYKSIILDRNSRDTLAKCFSIISRVLVDEGKWKLGVDAAFNSLRIVQSSKNNQVELLFNVYCGVSAVNNEELGHLYSNLNKLYGRIESINEAFYIVKILVAYFHGQLKCGNINQAVEMGFRLFNLNRKIHLNYFQIEIVLILDVLLIHQKRIYDVIYTAKYLKNMNSRYGNIGEISYQTICLLLIVETNFYLEPAESIANFAEQHFRNFDCEVTTPLENCMIVLMYALHVREGKCNKAENWKKLFRYDDQNCPLQTVFDIYNNLKFVETSSLSLCKDLSHSKNYYKSSEAISKILKNCLKSVEIWRIFLPRYFHCKAYLKKLTGKNSQTFVLLNKAEREANKSGNILEQSWIMLSRSCWKEEVDFSENTSPVHWRNACLYGIKQWSQMMYVLPSP